MSEVSRLPRCQVKHQIVFMGEVVSTMNCAEAAVKTVKGKRVCASHLKKLKQEQPNEAT